MQLEVKADSSMLNAFHFLWNIGNDSSDTEYFFATLNCGSSRNPLVGPEIGRYGDARAVQLLRGQGRPMVVGDRHH